MADSLAALRCALADNYTVPDGRGRGGMDSVYLADDTKRDRRVAIKTLKPGPAVPGGERFPRHLKIAARLEHPHTLDLYDSGEVDGLPHYVMRSIARM